MPEVIKAIPRTDFWSVPRAWEGETCIVMGSGPSLTRDQISYCRGKGRVIVINDTYRLVYWADVLHGCDKQWWDWHGECGARWFKGLKTTLDPLVPGEWDVRLLNNTGREGFDERSWCLRTGANGGYQAVHLAAHFGAKKIVLIGLDHRIVGDKSHWFGEHPNNARSPYAFWMDSWKTIVGPLEERGIEVTNCTPGSALTVFPQRLLEETI